jgi:hypothetical protein
VNGLGLASSNTKNRLPNEVEELIREAMKHPGVADVIQVYERAKDKLESVKPYLRVARTRQSFSVTDSVTY